MNDFGLFLKAMAGIMSLVITPGAFFIWVENPHNIAFLLLSIFSGIVLKNFVSGD